MKKTKKYKKIIKIDIGCTIITLGILFLGLWVEMKWIFWLGVILLGIFGFPILPNLIEYACESLYPVGEATISGLLIAGGQLMSFLTVSD